MGEARIKPEDRVKPIGPKHSRCEICDRRRSLAAGGVGIILLNNLTTWVCHRCAELIGDTARAAPAEGGRRRHVADCLGLPGNCTCPPETT